RPQYKDNRNLPQNNLTFCAASLRGRTRSCLPHPLVLVSLRRPATAAHLRPIDRSGSKRGSRAHIVGGRAPGHRGSRPAAWPDWSCSRSAAGLILSLLTSVAVHGGPVAAPILALEHR